MEVDGRLALSVEGRPFGSPFGEAFEDNRARRGARLWGPSDRVFRSLMSCADGTPFTTCPGLGAKCEGVKGDGLPGLADVSVLCWKLATAWTSRRFQQCGSNVSCQFDLQEEILAAMAHQARRSLRSLSASSCSSLSSVDTLSSSFSDPSPASLPPSDAQAGSEASQDEAPCVLGKRRRKRNAEKEVQRSAKRRKGNPRNRRRSKKERVDGSKMRQGMRHAVPSSVVFSALTRSKKIGKGNEVYDIETVKSMGVAVVPWDGV